MGNLLRIEKFHELGSNKFLPRWKAQRARRATTATRREGRTGVGPRPPRLLLAPGEGRVCWKVGLLAPGSAGRRAFPVHSAFRLAERPPALRRGASGPVARSTTVPGYSDGLAPDSHRLPADRASDADLLAGSPGWGAGSCSRITRPAPDPLGGHLPP